MMDPSLAAEAEIVGGKAHLIGPCLVHGESIAGIGAVGVEVVDIQLFALPVAHDLAVVVQIQLLVPLLKDLTLLCIGHHSLLKGPQILVFQIFPVR